MRTWEFDPAIGEERVAVLLHPPAFDEIVNMLSRDMQILCCHRQACDDMAGFSRVVFNLQASPQTLDLFFNSERGYRGSYFLSPYAGLAANDAALKRLMPRLPAWAKQHQPELDQTIASESLASPSAKVWLTESGSHLCPQCIGEWINPTDEEPEILNGRWEVADTPNGRRGRKAPRISKLRVFGAFLNDQHDEFVPARKRHRAFHISEERWS